MPSLSHTHAYRIVAGAVANVIHAHPTWKVPHVMVTSVAKRAAGTLLAHAAPEALAALRPSREPRRIIPARPVRGAPPAYWRSPLLKVSVAIGLLARDARIAGDEQRLATLVEVLRIVGAELKRGQERTGTGWG